MSSSSPAALPCLPDRGAAGVGSRLESTRACACASNPALPPPLPHHHHHHRAPADTSASPWLNLPAALAVVLGARWAALQLDTRLLQKRGSTGEAGGEGRTRRCRGAQTRAASRPAVPAPSPRARAAAAAAAAAPQASVSSPPRRPAAAQQQRGLQRRCPGTPGAPASPAGWLSTPGTSCAAASCRRCAAGRPARLRCPAGQPRQGRGRPAGKVSRVRRAGGGARQPGAGCGLCARAGAQADAAKLRAGVAARE